MSEGSKLPELPQTVGKDLTVDKPLRKSNRTKYFPAQQDAVATAKLNGTWDKLTEGEQKALEGRTDQRLSTRQIATNTGVSESSVRLARERGFRKILHQANHNPRKWDIVDEPLEESGDL